MICVSYSRYMSPDDGRLTISDQNKIITEYAKQKGLTISEKYSDRKHDENAYENFLILKQDGIGRKFECVIFVSMEYFGTGFLAANDILSRVFVPAQIHFVSVKDDFCSFEHTKEETVDYLKNRKSLYVTQAHPLNDRYCQGVLRSEQTKFGYLRVKGEDRLIIDTVAEPVVREIFKLASNGMTYSRISKILNEKSLMSSVQRLNQIYGRTEEGKEYAWNNQAVYKILHDPVYSGEWNFFRDGETVMLHCPAYLSKEEHNKIMLEAVKKKTDRARKANIFKSFVFDKDSGTKLEAQSSIKTGTRDYRFFKKNKKELKNRTQVVTVSQLNELVVNQILKEKKIAQKAVEYLNSKEGISAVKNLLASYRLKASERFTDLVAIIQQVSVTEEGPSEADIELMKKAETIEAELDALADEYNPEKTLYSTNNPWIKCYVFFEKKELDSKKEVKQYVDRIVFDRYGNCEIKLLFQEHKKALIELLKIGGEQIWAEKAEET